MEKCACVFVQRGYIEYMSNYSIVHMNRLWADHDVPRMSELFKMMGDPTRLGLLCLLLSGEKTPGELSAALRTTQSAVSHQLRLLRTYHLVASRRAGRNIFYSLADMHVENLLKVAAEHVDEPGFSGDPDSDDDGR